MRITIIGRSALSILRKLRTEEAALNAYKAGKCKLPLQATELLDPSPDPYSKWISRALVGLGLDDYVLFSKNVPLNVAVSQDKRRIQQSCVHNTVYKGGIPAKSFIEIGDGIAVSSPELLFIEMARVLSPAELAVLGCELCGTYACACDGASEAQFFTAPVTSIDDIHSYLRSCRGIRGLKVARQAIEWVADNSWSPMESLLCVLIGLPIKEGGYGIGTVAMNRRVPAQPGIMGASAKGSRVPDLMVAGTSVGINYDGTWHDGIDEVIRATMGLATNPGADAEKLFESAKQKARSKYVDDRRRDRELSAQGKIVLTVTKEDLNDPNGFDYVAKLLIYAIEQTTGRDMSIQRQTLDDTDATRDRHALCNRLLSRMGKER